MAKQATEVDRKTLETSLQSADNMNLPNSGAVIQKAIEIYNAGAVPAQITISIAMLRMKDWGLKINTKPGKRGRTSMTAEQIKNMQEARANAPRTSKKDKFSANGKIVLAFEKQKQRTPIALHQIIDRAQSGSAKAAIKLMCHQCMGWDHAPREIRNCTSLACPLYAFRPHQSANDNDELESVDSVDEEA